MYNFLYKDGQSLKFKGDSMNIYLPHNYFDKNIATYEGNFVTTIGILLFEVVNAANPTKNNFYVLKIPTVISFEFDENDTKKLKINGKEEVFDMFVLNNEGTFIRNTDVEMSAKNCKKFLDVVHNGYMPNIISYKDIVKLYLSSMDINDTDLGSPSTIYELIVSELCRYSKDVNKPFRMALKNPSVKETEYVNVNLKKIPMLNSTYASLSFENMNESIITSIERTYSNGTEKESPIEKTIKY